MEQYYELLVEKKATPEVRLKVFLVWAASILGIVAVLVASAYFVLFEVGLFVCAFFIMLAMLYQKRSSAEYEYIFVGGSMSVDKIVAKGQRVKITSVEWNDILDFGLYDKSVRAKYRPHYIYDHTVHKGQSQWYCYYYTKTKKSLLIFEPDETLLELIKGALPPAMSRSVFTGR